MSIEFFFLLNSMYRFYILKKPPHDTFNNSATAFKEGLWQKHHHQQQQQQHRQRRRQQQQQNPFSRINFAWGLQLSLQSLSVPLSLLCFLLQVFIIQTKVEYKIKTLAILFLI